MPIKNSDLNELSNRIYEFVCSLLEDEIEPNEICVGLASHAARLGLQSEPNAMNVVGNLFLPIVHQLLDESNYDLNSDQDDDRNLLITHECRTLQ